MQYLAQLWEDVHFNPPSPCGEGHQRSLSCQPCGQISIHPPRVGRDVDGPSAWETRRNFNPPSPCGEGPIWSRSAASMSTFQSTLPVWGGTPHGPDKRGLKPFQSTLPVWGGTCTRERLASLPLRISIHPPRVGRDPALWHGWPGSNGISIHPPRVGRDRCTNSDVGLRNRFQSTLPVWGGTSAGVTHGLDTSYFNPPSPCGEGQQKLTKILCKLLR